ncbi:hypothetical protein HMI54_009943 [Coelomomyces lativittatus]|nr:hypothetical protein HMI54_009943 [Coelomomyces lativittatus]
MEEGLKSRASKKSTVAALGKKANKEDIEMLQREKASVSDLEAIREELELIKQLKVFTNNSFFANLGQGVGSPMKEPTSLRQLERAHNELKATMNEFLGLLSNKVSRNEFEEVLGRSTRSKISSISGEIDSDFRKELSLKANIKDVITLLDTKAGTP